MCIVSVSMPISTSENLIFSFSGKQQSAIRTDRKIYSLLIYHFCMVITILEHFFLRCLNFENARRSLFIDVSSINSSFKNLPSHLKVELLLFGDSKLPAIDNNLILKASIKYIMTTNRFSVPLFWYCFFL